MRRFRWTPLSLVGGLLLASPLWGCPNCKSAVADQGAGMASGFAWSILLLIGTPALIVAIWAWVLFRLSRII
jgi:hypothetical protein